MDTHIIKVYIDGEDSPHVYTLEAIDESAAVHTLTEVVQDYHAGNSGRVELWTILRKGDAYFTDDLIRSQEISIAS